MNKIHPKKLLNSKWTALQPVAKQLHFIVTDVEYDEDGSVLTCMIESVMSKNKFPIQWRDLKDTACWAQGWQKN